MPNSNAFNDSDDGDDAVCPLCCEPMDLSDKNFVPCPCGYRVCMWCWHRIKENYTGLCPACRSEYADDPHAFAAVDKEEVIKNENNKKKRAKQRDTDSTGAAAAAAAAREHQHALHLRHHHQHQQHMQHLHREQVQQQGGGRGGGGVGGATSVANRRELANMRVVQRNLVYATGLPAGLDSEEVLRRPENFGQYGKIYKIAISVSQTSEPRPGNFSAHITFAHKEDALACILATDGFWLEGRQLRSNFGTTKYCATYLRNSPCSNPDCLYLHELGDEEDRFTKEEIQQRSLLAPPIPPGAVTVTGGGGPSGTGMRCNSPYLPPPVYESSSNGSGNRESGAAARSQGQQGAAAAGGATVAQRAAAARGAKPTGQAAAAPTALKTSGSTGVAWGGAGATNGASAQSLGERSGVAVVTRGKGPMGVASPTASPHLQAHNPARLQEEWPSLADTAAPAPAPTPTPAATTTNRTSRNRRKKEKQQQQQLQQQQQQQQQQKQQQQQQQQLPKESGWTASAAAPPSSPPQEPAALAPAAGAGAAAAVPSSPAPRKPPVVSQPPGLGPVAGVPALPQTSVAPAGVASSPGDAAAAAAGGPPLEQDGFTGTTSAGSQDTSSSMFFNPFFSNGGRGAAGGAGGADMPSVVSAPPPPGFSEPPPAAAAAAAPSDPATASSSSPSTVASSSPVQETQPAQPGRSLFEEHFGSGGGGGGGGGGRGDSVFDGGMFSSAAIGGGLFAGGAGTGPAASAAGTARAAGSPPPGLPSVPGATDVPRVSQQLERSSPAGREPQDSPVEQPQPDMKASISELLHRPTKGLGKGAAADGESDMSFSSVGAGTEPTGFGLDGTTSTSAHVAASPFGAVSGGGHFGGAFGSALFPVSTHQGGATRGHGGLGGTDGPGADLSVDPFANSSGALARMLGVTLPPVDSHSSLARKMRSGVGVSPVGGAMQQDTSPSRSHVPPRGGGAYADFSRDMDRGRPGGHGGPGKAGARDASGVERSGGARHEYGDNHKGGGALQDNHQASRFSFAQDDNPGMPFSPARGSPQMGPDLRGSPGGMGSPSHPGQHHHLHHHHQSHAHRPFGEAGQGAGQSVTPPQLSEFGGGAEGHFAPPPPPHHHHPHHSQHHFQQQQQQQQRQPPPPPPQQQQQQQQPQQHQQPSQPQQQQQQQPQYSIQNGMAFLQKVLPGVSLSYGDANRQQPPAGAGGGGQGQGQPQGQPQGQGGASPAGVPTTSGGVGWGDTTTQRVDPAQAFGSSMWTMAPAPNAPRQPQGSRGGGYGAW